MSQARTIPALDEWVRAFRSGRVSRRDFTRGLLGLGLSLSAVNALSAPLSAAQAEVSGDLRVVVQPPQIAAKQWEEFKTAFTTAYPNVNIEFVPIAATTWSELFDTLSVRIAGGEEFDVVYMPTQGWQVFASRGLVEPLDPFIERDKTEVDQLLNDISPALLELTRQYGTPPGDSATYYLPYVHNTLTMYINREMFEAAGVPEPSNDWTWDDFAEAARAVAKPGETFAYNVPSDEFGLGPWLFSNGAAWFSEDWTRATCGSPEAVEAVTFLKQFIDEGLSPEPGGQFDAFAQFADNRLAMFFSGRWGTTSLQGLDAVDKTLIVDPPQKTQKATIIGVGALPILEGSANKEAAWAFVKHSLSEEVQSLWARFGTEVPARVSVVRSAAFTDNSPEGSIRLEDTVEHATMVFGGTNATQIGTEIVNAMQQILVGNVEVDQGMSDLEDRINGLMQE